MGSSKKREGYCMGRNPAYGHAKHEWSPRMTTWIKPSDVSVTNLLKTPTPSLPVEEEEPGMALRTWPFNQWYGWYPELPRIPLPLFHQSYHPRFTVWCLGFSSRPWWVKTQWLTSFCNLALSCALKGWSQWCHGLVNMDFYQWFNKVINFSAKRRSARVISWLIMTNQGSLLIMIVFNDAWYW